MVLPVAAIECYLCSAKGDPKAPGEGDCNTNEENYGLKADCSQADPNFDACAKAYTS